MALPTSDTWQSLDVGLTEMPDFLTQPGVEQSRGSPFIYVDSENYLVVFSDDSAVSSVRVAIPFSEVSSTQIELKFSHLPPDFRESIRLFIGFYNQQGHGGGLLFSRMGLCIVSGPDSVAIPFPGSQELFSEGTDDYVLRLIIEGESMNVYLTRASDVAVSGHRLCYTAATPLSPEDIADELLIYALGTLTYPVEIHVSALRADGARAIIPNQRPIADAGPDQTSNVGSAITLDGSRSYDPEGRPLFYRWSLLDAPDGSRYKSTGTDGRAYDDGGPGFYTNLFYAPGSPFSEENMPLLQPGDKLLLNGSYYTVSTERWTFNFSTRRYDRDLTQWDDCQIVLTEQELPKDLSGQAWAIVHSATFFDDSSAGNTYAIPDATGLYTIELVVNDGELDSLPSQTLVNVTQTAIALGSVPDVSWIWKTLPDFWRLLEDRGIIEKFWSGFTHACAANLLAAWQVDYNKSLLDVQRTFQRKWLSYKSFLEEAAPEEAKVKIIRSPIFTGNLGDGVHFTESNNVLQLILDAGSVQTITFAVNSPDPGPGYYTNAAGIADQINTQLGIPIASVVALDGWVFVKLEYPTLLRIRPGGSANDALGFSALEYRQNDLRGAYGGPREPGAATAFDTFYATPRGGSPVYAYTMPAGPPVSGGSGPTAGVFILDPPVLDFDAEGIENGDLLVWQGRGYRILKTALYGSQRRSLVLRDELDYADEDPPLRTPWVVPSTVTSTTLNFTSELVEAGDVARFEVRHVKTRTYFAVNCPVLGARENVLGFDAQPLLEVWAGIPSDYETKFLGVCRIKNIAVDPLIISIPRLQGTIHNPVIYWTENKDYTIDDQAGFKAIRFRDGVFTALSPPPDVLWAEITYLDNRPAVEANFGNLVGLGIEQLQEQVDKLDYLSAVRGLWWAHFSGPALHKIKTGLQILLGLPFAEETGVIEHIDEHFSATEGRIVVRDLRSPNVVRTYYYPSRVGLALSPTTGQPLAVGDVVEQFDPLSAGIEITDWISDPRWVQDYCRLGRLKELERFFKFSIRADVDAFSLSNLAFAVEFVQKIRPHYTSALFALLKRLASEVDISDQLSITTRQLFRDPIYPRNGSITWDDSDGSGNCRNHYDDPPPQFAHDVCRLYPSTEVWATLGYTHSGSGGWRYDTIWAYDDGGGQDRIPLSGPDSEPPPPYGPPVGVVSFDATVDAGTYHRSRTL